MLLFYFIITIIAFTIFKIQFSTFILSRFGRDLVLGGTSCMLEAHKAITKRNFFIYFVFMSTTGQEVGLITGGPSSVWEFNQIHGVSYCVILKMAVNKKDQCCMGIQVNSRRQLYSLEFSIKYTLPYIYFNCFCLLCGYFPDPLLITCSALESEWNFHTTHTAKARNISGLL